MKTTVDLPDPLFRRAKATAAHRGISMKTLFTQAIEKDLEEPKMSVTELLKSLPKVEKETTEEIMRSVAESDAFDLAWQREQAARES
jgi:hypothetical protein